MTPAKRKIQLVEGQGDNLKVVSGSQPRPAPFVRKSLLKTQNWSSSTVQTLMDREVAP